MVTTFRYGIFVPPHGAAPEATVRALSDATGLSAVDCRMILRSQLVRRVASTRTREEARDRVLTLKGAGFDAFAVSFEALTRNDARHVRSCRFEGDDVVFPNAGRVRPGDLRLILLGAFERGTLKVERNYRSDYHSHMGFVPSVNVGTQRRRSTETELFLHLYGKTHRRVIEVRSKTFNFSCLGKDRGYAGAVNLRKLCRRLRRIHPVARYDDRLLKSWLRAEEYGGRTHYGGIVGDIQVRRTKKLSNEDRVRAASRLLAIHALGG